MKPITKAEYETAHRMLRKASTPQEARDVAIDVVMDYAFPIKNAPIEHLENALRCWAAAIAEKVAAIFGVKSASHVRHFEDVIYQAYQEGRDSMQRECEATQKSTCYYTKNHPHSPGSDNFQVVLQHEDLDRIVAECAIERDAIEIAERIRAFRILEVEPLNAPKDETPLVGAG